MSVVGGFCAVAKEKSIYENFSVFYKIRSVLVDPKESPFLLKAQGISSQFRLIPFQLHHHFLSRKYKANGPQKQEVNPTFIG